MYNPRYMIELIAGNLRKSRNAFGIPNRLVNTWHKKVPLAARRPGDALLFTGLMYQSVPYIQVITRALERFEDTSVAAYARYAGLARYIPGFLAGGALSLLGAGAEKARFDAILDAVYRVLVKSGTGFFYLPEADLYSGILLYDLGDQEGFEAHARYVAGELARHHVEKIITVDPHTTYALKVLYPKYIGASYDVKTYFELASPTGRVEGAAPVVIHDPCFYGRYLGLSDVPARVLSSLGIPCVDIPESGRFTQCCGGPAESVSPALAHEVNGRRAEQLLSAGAPIITMCPLCMANFMRAGVPVEDLASLLARHA